MLKKVAVFVSGGGSNLQSLIDVSQNTYEITLVISDKENAFALERAESNNIKSAYFGKNNFPNKKERTQATLKLLQEMEIEYIVLAGYLSIVPTELIQAYPQKIINIHPSLIPSFCGMGYYGHFVHEAVLKAGVKISGATVHFVDEGVDTGAILMQKSVDIATIDTAEEIAQAVLKVEHEILPQALLCLCQERITIQEHRTIISK